MKENLQRDNKCSNCGKPLDAHTQVNPEVGTPSSGDISLCFYCGNLAVFNEDLTLRDIDEDTMKEIMDKEPIAYGQILKAQRMIFKRVKLN